MSDELVKRMEDFAGDWSELMDIVADFPELDYDDILSVVKDYVDFDEESDEWRLFHFWLANPTDDPALFDVDDDNKVYGYLVLSDDEADALCADYIADSLWAFRPEFLAYHCEIDDCVFECLQERCEDSNDAIRRLIDKCGNFNEFVKEAISADGRGHFLATYDSEEIEVGNAFLYRVD